MNRRDMLKLTCAAPVVAQFVAKAAIDETYGPRFVGLSGMQTVTLDWTEVNKVLMPSIAHAQKIIDGANQARTLLNRTRELSGRLSVESQMIAHDIFDMEK